MKKGTELYGLGFIAGMTTMAAGVLAKMVRNLRADVRTVRAVAMHRQEIQNALNDIMDDMTDEEKAFWYELGYITW